MAKPVYGWLVGLAIWTPQGVVAQNGALSVEADSTMPSTGEMIVAHLRYGIDVVTVDASRLSEARADVVERTGESTLVSSA